MRRSTEACSRLLSMIVAMSKEVGLECPISNLTLSMFKGEGKAPRLKLKAAETRRMLPILRAVCSTCFSITGEHEALRFFVPGQFVFSLFGDGQLDRWWGVDSKTECRWASLLVIVLRVARSSI